MYDRLKDELPRILELVEQVPEPLKQRCFEVLLSHLLRSIEAASPAAPSGQVQLTALAGPAVGSPPAIPGRVRAFMRRYRLDESQLQRVVMVENGEIHFILEPHEVPNALGQIQWALLLALRSALTGGAFDVDPEGVRSICIEKGYYDGPNFAAIFKRAANAKLFRGEMAPQGKASGLSDEGERRLAELIQTLAGQGHE